MEPRYIELAEQIGVTRIADTTGLDRLGIFTASCVVPTSTDSITVYSGKGKTWDIAVASAIAEAAERTCCVWNDSEVHEKSLSSINTSNENVVPPSQFTELHAPYGLDTQICWTPCEIFQYPISAEHCKFAWAPAELVFGGKRPSGIPKLYSFVSSNGLATSFDFEKAVLHGVLEVCERDAVSQMELLSNDYAALFFSALSDCFQLAQPTALSKIPTFSPRAVSQYSKKLDISTCPESIGTFIERFSKTGINVSVRVIESEIGLPIVGAACIERMGADTFLCTAGYAARLTIEGAVIDALLELAQSRATDRQGAREDCMSQEKQRLKYDPWNMHWLFVDDEPYPFKYFVELEDTPISLADIALRLEGCGLGTILIKRFNAAAASSAQSLRVMIPGVETWHVTGGKSKIGNRVAKLVTGD